MEDDPDPDPITEFKCHYCSGHLSRDGGETRWEDDLQYVILRCDCGKKNMVRVFDVGIDPKRFYDKDPVVEPERPRKAFGFE